MVGGGVNFLEQTAVYPGSIITNPPYKYVSEFVLKALELVGNGHHVYMFLKLTALEGQERYNRIFSKHPPKRVYVFSKRIPCAKNGNFNDKGSAVAYAWYVWEKGYTGETILKWIQEGKLTMEKNKFEIGTLVKNINYKKRLIAGKVVKVYRIYAWGHYIYRYDVKIEMDGRTFIKRYPEYQLRAIK